MRKGKEKNERDTAKKVKALLGAVQVGGGEDGGTQKVAVGRDLFLILAV